MPSERNWQNVFLNETWLNVIYTVNYSSSDNTAVPKSKVPVGKG